MEENKKSVSFFDKIKNRLIYLTKKIKIENDIEAKSKILKDIFDKIEELDERIGELDDYKERIELNKKKRKLKDTTTEVVKKHYLDDFTDKDIKEITQFKIIIYYVNLVYSNLLKNKELIYSKNSRDDIHLKEPTLINDVNEILSYINFLRVCVHNELINKLSIRNYYAVGIDFSTLGDFYLQMYIILNDVPVNKIQNEEIINKEILFKNAFDCYDKSCHYLSEVDIPRLTFTTYKIKLKFKHLDIFYFFFPHPVDFHDVREKRNYLIKTYPNFFNNCVQSYCWKSNGLCDYRTTQTYNINEGDGVFLSMKYNDERNEKLKDYIKKILEYNNLKMVIKEERLRTPSWTKEICCSIFNNKYSIVLLDKDTPNVIFELGIAIGMGRKVIILINQNQKDNIEEELFSMIRDYECIYYKNVNEFFEMLYNAIQGIFFNIVDYKMPKITRLFSKKERDEFEKEICNNKE